jgi:hypothetical protein
MQGGAGRGFRVIVLCPSAGPGEDRAGRHDQVGGGQAFAGKINEEMAITFDQPGGYGDRCKPHYRMGMVGMVGEPANAGWLEAGTHAGEAKQVFGVPSDKLATIATKEPG